MTSRGKAAGGWILALLPFFLILALNWGPGPPGEATDAYHYLLHGRALAEGAGYTNTGYIFTELNPWVGPRVQPPGMAILLFPVFKFFGANVFVMRLLVLLCAIAFLLLAGWAFAQHEGLYFGLSVTLLVGVIPTLAIFATHTYADLVSAAALWAVICVVDSERPFDRTKLTLVTLFGAMALMTRLTGVALLGALVLFTLVRYRDFGLRPLIPAAIWSAAGLAAVLTFGGMIPVWAFDGFRMVRQWIATVLSYRFAFFEIILYPFRNDLAADVYHVVAFGVLILGLGEWLRRGWNRFVTWFVIAYVLMIMSLPINGMGRYLWPIAPFVLFGLLNGVRTGVRLLAPRLTRDQLDRTVLATAVVLALACTVTLASNPRVPSLIEDPGLQEVVQFVRAMEGAGSARVAFEHPRMLTWETRVPAMGMPHRLKGFTVERFIEELSVLRITHVIRLNRSTSSGGGEVIREAIEESPDMFTLLHRGPDFAVYEVGET